MSQMFGKIFSNVTELLALIGIYYVSVAYTVMHRAS